MTTAFPTTTIVAQDTANNADSVSGIVTRAGSCVGVLAALIADTNTSIPFEFSGGTARSGTHLWFTGNLENLGSLTVAANTIFAATSGNVPTGTLGLDVTLPGGFDGRGLELRQPASNNLIAKTFGDGFHSDASVCYLPSGEFGRLEVEMLTNRIFASRGNALLGQIFGDRDAGDLDPQDKYHTSCPVYIVDGGFVLFAFDHNTRVYMLKATTFDGLASASSTPVTPSGQGATYVSGDVDDQGTIIFQSRLRVPGAPGVTWLLLTKIVDPMGTATVTNLYMANGQASRQPYTRGLTFEGVYGGKRLWIGHVQVREDGGNETWLFYSAYVYDATDNKVYDIAKVDRTNSDGSGTSNGLVANDILFGPLGGNPNLRQTNNGAGLVILASLGWAVTGNRYISDICGGKINGDEDGWTNASVIAAFVDRAGTSPLAYGASDVRLVWQTGTTRVPTTALANPLGLNTPYSYRVPIIFLPDGDDMIVWAIDQKTDGYMSTSPAVFYYNGFGGDGYLRKRRIANWASHTTEASLIAAISTPSGWTDIQLPEVAMNIKPIRGLGPDHVYLDIMQRDDEADAPRGVSQTAQQGAFWSPTQDLAFAAAASAGGSRSRARYNRAR